MLIHEHEADKIRRISLPIVNSVLMANDVPEFVGRTNENEIRSKIVLNTNSNDDRLLFLRDF